jgi:hypothetical protein
MATDVDLAERAFQAAFQRMCGAQTFDEVAIEVSNMLNQLYRLSEAAARHLGGGKALLYQNLARTSGGEEATAALWARTFDAHDLFQLVASSDLYSDYYTDMGVPAWKPRSQLPPPDPRYAPRGRDLLYNSSLAGRPLPDTAQVAVRAVRSLLP